MCFVFTIAKLKYVFIQILYLEPEIFGQHCGNVQGQADAFKYLNGVAGAVQAQTANHFCIDYSIRCVNKKHKIRTILQI